MPWPVTLGVYRIIMELVNNTIKHAEATMVTIELQYYNYCLQLDFKDDGKGINIVEGNTAGMGFKNIEARTTALKGPFEFGTNAGNTGFNALIKLPIAF